MSHYPIGMCFSDELQRWVAEAPDLPGCKAGGDTPGQALARLDQAKEAWFEQAR